MAATMKKRHKKMARCAFRSLWHYREWSSWRANPGGWVGPFAKWHEAFRSINP